jgi:3-hydroxy-3-methylglutaryl CoA synthase/uncharacterized OB-fold protein
MTDPTSGPGRAPFRGIVSWGAYLPYWRLDRGQIAPFVGQGGGKGTRTVASFDEDPTTLAVEAARLALRGTGARPQQVLFGTVAPAYADKTNATVVHAALRLDESASAFDLGLSARSALGGLLLALRAGGLGTTLVTSGDVRGGLAGSGEEATGGDAGTAFVVGSDDPANGVEVVAELIGTGSVTDEFVERWRVPGDNRTRVWDEKFSEVRLVPLGVTAWQAALADAGVAADEVALAAVSAPIARVASSLAGKLGGVKVIDNLANGVGQSGAAQPGLLLASLLEQAEAGQVVALVSLADGADVLLFRTTEAFAGHRPARSLAEQLATGGALPYGKYLSWRGNLQVEPPRRPEPQRVSASAAARTEEWKFGFVGSQDDDTGMVHMPPQRVSRDGSRTDAMHDKPMADVQGTIVTFTVDRLAYSPSPPIVFAVVDFDGGGRLPVELCDCTPDEVATGKRVEMTFRRLFTADGLPNYFWKGRLVRGEHARG